MNRPVREPYARWCESLNLSQMAQIGLLDLYACASFVPALVKLFALISLVFVAAFWDLAIYTVAKCGHTIFRTISLI